MQINRLEMLKHIAGVFGSITFIKDIGFVAQNRRIISGK
jgi:hypothetical protein